MKKRGFTLIELLTVIAILAIVLLISAPVVLGVLEKAQKNMFKNQVLLYVTALKNKIALQEIDQTETNIVLPIDGNTVDVDISAISMESTVDFEGTISIKNESGKYTYTIKEIFGNGYVLRDKLSTSIKTTDIEKIKETKEYNIGDRVTLVNGSVWYVIEKSNKYNNNVVLFASKNASIDGSSWNESVYGMTFDESTNRRNSNNPYCTSTSGCNIYAANQVEGVTEDSSIKVVVDNAIRNFVNTGLTSNVKEIRLITLQELTNLGCNFEGTPTCASAPSYITNTRYWTMTPNPNNTSGVWVVISSTSFNNNANSGYNFGVRPVIKIDKENISE